MWSRDFLSYEIITSKLNKHQVHVFQGARAEALTTADLSAYENPSLLSQGSCSLPLPVSHSHCPRVGKSCSVCPDFCQEGIVWDTMLIWSRMGHTRNRNSSRLEARKSGIFFPVNHCLTVKMGESSQCLSFLPVKGSLGDSFKFHSMN